VKRFPKDFAFVRDNSHLFEELAPRDDVSSRVSIFGHLPTSTGQEPESFFNPTQSRMGFSFVLRAECALGGFAAETKADVIHAGGRIEYQTGHRFCTAGERQ
jgi:hypothetical protein